MAAEMDSAEVEASIHRGALVVVAVAGADTPQEVPEAAAGTGAVSAAVTVSAEAEAAQFLQGAQEAMVAAGASQLQDSTVVKVVCRAR